MVKPYSESCDQNKAPILEVLRKEFLPAQAASCLLRCPWMDECRERRMRWSDPPATLVHPCTTHVLEIGSGTGQHAIYFGEHLPHLTWQTSDIIIYHPGIRAWLDEAALPNVLPPLALDVEYDPWPTKAAPAHPCAHGTWTSTVQGCTSAARGRMPKAACPAQFDAVFSANTVHIMSWPQVQCMFAGIGGVLTQGGVLCLYGPFNYNGAFTSPSNARFDAWLKVRDPVSGVRDFEALDLLARNAGMVLTQDYEMPANNRTLVWRKI